MILSPKLSVAYSNKFSLLRSGIVYICFIGVLANTAKGQWITQSITLKPGFNAVYLEVQPEPNDCDSIFNGIDVKSVWDFSKEVASVQFVDDPNELLPKQPDWLVWFPSDSPNRVARNLFVLVAGRSYLINYSGNSDFQWEIKGVPRPEVFPWIPDSFNLRGFSVDDASLQTFQDFFAPSPAHAGQSIYRLNNSTSAWELIDNPATETMKRGEAYWVFSLGPSNYLGPVEIEFDFGDGIDFGNILSTYELRFNNLTSSAKDLTLTLMNSESVPATIDSPLLAGGVPLSYFNVDLQVLDNFGFLNFPDPLSCPVAAADDKILNLQVRRQDMTPFTVPEGKEALYQSVLAVSDGEGFLRYLPVTAEGVLTATSANAARRATRGPATQANVMVRKGLWVGTVVVNAVSQPENESDPNIPTPVGSEYQFRVILHQDAGGNFRFLQQVYLLFKQGTLKEDPPGSGIMVVDRPGEYVLITDDELIDNYGGSTIRDTDTVGRRLSTVNFGFDEPVAMNSSTPSGKLTVSCSIPMDYQHRLNPFVHKFHPDHNNLDERYENTLPEGMESYSFTRQLEFEFSETDPEDLAIGGYGDTILGGTFRETVTGIHRQPIHSSGVFRINHASSVEVLNDGN